jgi:hypothetical protein
LRERERERSLRTKPCAIFCISVTKIPENNLKRGLLFLIFWLTISECQSIMVGRVWLSRDVHIMVNRKQRKRGSGTRIHPQ